MNLLDKKIGRARVKKEYRKLFIASLHEVLSDGTRVYNAYNSLGRTYRMHFWNQEIIRIYPLRIP